MKEPAKGFYYHYKHDPTGSVGNYAYEVLNIGHHTEVADFDEAAMVVYRPLYEAKVYKAGKHWDIRPLKMFMETVEKDGKIMPRFSKIVDPDIISQLKHIKIEMYGTDN